jgi:hypothetical protein
MYRWAVQTHINKKHAEKFVVKASSFEEAYENAKFWLSPNEFIYSINKIWD